MAKMSGILGKTIILENLFCDGSLKQTKKTACPPPSTDYDACSNSSLNCKDLEQVSSLILAGTQDVASILNL